MAAGIQRNVLTGLIWGLAGLSVIGPAGRSVYAAAEPEQAVLDEIVDPGLTRREIRNLTLPSQDFEAGLYAGALAVDGFGTGVLVGLGLGYHVSEDLFFEANYGRSQVPESPLASQSEALSSSERQLSYYSLSVGYNLWPGESFWRSRRAYNSALYLIGGAGNTDFADTTAFTVHFGAGFRLFFSHWLALRLDARDHMFRLDLGGDEQLTHNLAGTVGVTFFF